MQRRRRLSQKEWSQRSSEEDGKQQIARVVPKKNIAESAQESGDGKQQIGEVVPKKNVAESAEEAETKVAPIKKDP
ncbi:hypothetical protein CCACVL1_11200 [Corchorus capsularis]|uniref:Uncharacterized protein n=1 Tax=Corchorus capsularis TaxID=210143 RepID=A0A1R3IMH5_COCAP|nr:hypothetical protein CCACVL1_11200 [Corchorus capsularis]